MKVPFAPFGPRGRRMIAITLALLAAIWVVCIIGYLRLPERIPTHFRFGGRPDSFGGTWVLLLIPFAFSIAPAIMLAVLRIRFALLNNYPDLVHFPASFASLALLSDERKAYWVNRYFELMAAFTAGLTLFLFVLTCAILLGTQYGYIPPWFVTATFVLPFAILVLFVIGTRRLARAMKEESGAATSARG